MTKQEKTAVIEELKGVFANLDFFYITDASTLSVEKINNFRRTRSKSRSSKQKSSYGYDKYYW